MLFFSIVLLSLVLFFLGGYFYFQKESLIVDVFSHVAFPGVVLTFILFKSLNLYLVLICSTFIVLFFDYLKQMLLYRTNFSSDSIFAFLISFGFSLGIVFVNFLQNMGVSTKLGFNNFLFGNITALSNFDSLLIIILGFLVLCTLFFLRKIIFNLLFDYKFLLQRGIKASFVNSVVSFVTVIMTVLSLKVAGVVLTTGLFLIPFATANIFCKRIKSYCLFAIVLISLVSYFAMFLSQNFTGLSTGPVLIFTYFSVFILSYSYKYFLNYIKRG